MSGELICAMPGLFGARKKKSCLGGKHHCKAFAMPGAELFGPEQRDRAALSCLGGDLEATEARRFVDREAFVQLDARSLGALSMLPDGPTHHHPGVMVTFPKSVWEAFAQLGGTTKGKSHWSTPLVCMNVRRK